MGEQIAGFVVRVHDGDNQDCLVSGRGPRRRHEFDGGCFIFAIDQQDRKGAYRHAVCRQFCVAAVLHLEAAPLKNLAKHRYSVRVRGHH